ncbi:AraC family transcriptional regulator [Aquipseudomonas alcaligenes]|uniref:AraC family transcriptional regulator n=1 Tax=Aquipseudomonas alcaligenes TaxID=43263 RepID=UPI001658C5B4|nr:AraC family transcriptional regulator [Pseudomonas alcaligenes]
MNIEYAVRDPSSVNLIIRFAEERGVPSKKILRRTGLTQEQLKDPNFEVQANQEICVIENLIEACGCEPYLGIEVGLRYGFTTYGIWGFALISSATVGAALDLAWKFQRLTSSFTQSIIEVKDGVIFGKFIPPSIQEPISSFLLQRDLAGTVRLISEIAGSEFKLKEIQLSTSPINSSSLQCELNKWIKCPIRYGASMNAIVFDFSQLSFPLPNANPLAAAVGEQMCAALQEKRRTRHGTINLVRSHLLLPTGNIVPDLAEISKILHTSERTLRRRLKDEGTSFRDILSSVQLQFSCELLQDTSAPINEIALRLGYSDQAAFSQAFKRWTQLTPSQWRNKSRD